MEILEEIIHLTEHALLDALQTLPFLFLAYLLIEYMEHKASDKMRNGLQKLGPFGPVGGALLGIIPQCGFSVAASNFYAGRIISVGTLLAVYLSTSDEAIPVLLSQPAMRGYILPVLAIKFVCAVVFGFAVDLVVKHFVKRDEEAPFEELCAECDCDHHGIVRSALHHTVRIFIFILLVNLLMEVAIHFVGEEKISGLLLNGSVFQPFLTSLIGLIP
ncbi:MAG: arsenic efflux protein, partial [Clostridia bacterium]|nr:arsenic efflux protein [Clostridia bacterium]